MLNDITAIGPASNDAASQIECTRPYAVEVELTGVAPLLFHRWSCESVAEKSAAKKGSKAKKTDDVDSYVYRDDAGFIALPSEYIRQSMIYAAKFQQDPRSPRKSAFDLFKAAIAGLDVLCSLGTKNWDYLDQRRVQVQRNGVTRVRPAMHAGWKVTCKFQVLLPEYVSPAFFHEVLSSAGRLIGVADFRPTYGRFAVSRFEVLAD